VDDAPQDRHGRDAGERGEERDPHPNREGHVLEGHLDGHGATVCGHEPGQTREPQPSTMAITKVTRTGKSAALTKRVGPGLAIVWNRIALR
jgi:hypothetical protein